MIKYYKETLAFSYLNKYYVTNIAKGKTKSGVNRIDLFVFNENKKETKYLTTFKNEQEFLNKNFTFKRLTKLEGLVLGMPYED